MLKRHYSNTVEMHAGHLRSRIHIKIKSHMRCPLQPQLLLPFAPSPPHDILPPSVLLSSLRHPDRRRTRLALQRQSTMQYDEQAARVVRLTPTGWRQIRVTDFLLNSTRRWFPAIGQLGRALKEKRNSCHA